MSVLSIRGLGKSFGAVDALKGLDLDVAQGSRTAVVGPSGSGKTTLLRLVAGFEAPDAGQIHLEGRLLADANLGVPAHKRQIGLVMQEGALFPHLSILDNIRFGISDEADSQNRAMALLDLVELDRSMALRQPHQLSGGQQQRVALARALARRPRLMLLDEPFSALDTGLREQMREATADILSAAGVATVLVTHDQDEAMGFADQLVILRDGRLVQAGRPRDLYLFPADPQTAAFLGPAIVLDADIRDGHAQTAIGLLPLQATQFSSAGPARILLRPEQIRLSEGDTQSSWRLASVEEVGRLVRVVLVNQSGDMAANPPTLTFETIGQCLPSAGAPIAVTISGPAHRFS